MFQRLKAKLERLSYIKYRNASDKCIPQISALSQIRAHIRITALTFENGPLFESLTVHEEVANGLVIYDPAVKGWSNLI